MQPEGTISGTPAFMAPEQAASELPTAAADWYSFGVLIYLALTGQLPFAGTPELVLVAKQNEDADAAVGADRGVPRRSRSAVHRRCCRGGRPIARRASRCWRQLGIVADDQTLTGGDSSRAAFVGRQDGAGGAARGLRRGGGRRDGERVRARRQRHGQERAGAPLPRRARRRSRGGRSCSRGAVTSARACRTRRSTTSSIA